ncbi:MAG: Sec-independent protein translocase protein TatB [Pseudomonadota bacterium]
MFDIGFSELMVIAVVALIVIGPERLPKVARTLGHLFGRMQRYVNDVKADISREMELDELRKLQTTVQDAARSFEQSVTNEVNATGADLRKIAQDADPLSTHSSLPSTDTPSATPPPELPAIASAAPVDTALTPAEASAQLKLDIDSPPAAVEKGA